MEKSRPFLKWAGGKYRILHHIIPKLPNKQRLIEPFVGAGSVFLNSEFEEYLLNDINADLINLYSILKTEGKTFIASSKKLFTATNNNADIFYKFRDKFNACEDQTERAALFIYLNRHGFNGLCRYNKGGGFNVPFGKIPKPYFPEAQMLHFFEKSQRAIFTCESFETIICKAKKTDVIYCDPPYVPLNQDAAFNGYSAYSFDLAAQEKLAKHAKAAAKKSIPVLISNHDLAITRDLYRGADVTSFDVGRRINCDASKRKPVKEILAVFGK